MRTADEHDGLRAALTAVVVAHLVVLAWHYSAHTHLPVPLSPPKLAFVFVVVLALPVVGAGLVWTERKRAGSWLIFWSMLASLVFGFVSHYIVPSEDHVSTLPAHAWRPSFIVSAGLLVVTETMGVTFGAVGALRWRRGAARDRALVDVSEPASAP